MSKAKRMELRWGHKESVGKAMDAYAEYLDKLKSGKVQPKLSKLMAPPASTGGGSVIPNFWSSSPRSTSTSPSLTAVPSTSMWGSGTISSSGTISFGPMSFVGEDQDEDPEGSPSDDTTRAMAERRVLRAIDECLREDHYPKGIAVSEELFSLLQGSPLVRTAMHSWFMNIKLIVISTEGDPWFVQAGW